MSISWWPHQMETFSALLAICAGNSLVPGEFPTRSPVMRSFYVFFDLHLNKRLSKQSWGWSLKTISCPLWHHRNVILTEGNHGAWFNTLMSRQNGHLFTDDTFKCIFLNENVRIAIEISLKLEYGCICAYIGLSESRESATFGNFSGIM